MAFKFPFTNYHELNLTWVLDQLKALFEKSEENITTIETYDGRLSTVEAELPVVAETASEASRAAAAAGTLAQTAKTTADTAQNNAIQAQGLAGTARQEAQAAQNAANEATQAAQQAQATAQNFDGRITQAENDASQALEASRSFENRVQSAITTANNANQTATNAQGIAMRADQNAGAALDKIGDLSDLTTTAKQNLVAAINEAAASGGGGGGGGGAVSSVNGKTGAVVLDAGDLDFNSSATYNQGTVGAELSDQKNAIGKLQYGNYYGAQELNIGKSINTASGVNIIPSSIRTESGFCCLCIPCVPGDLFIISGAGGSQTRLWAFSDSSGNAITQATASESATKKELTAPANSAYFAFNSRTNVSYSVYKKQQLIIATTTNDGLMSASDKTKLEDVYADYSSALVALGVI